jgi:hypothetical protein
VERTRKVKQSRQAPIHIPLDFETAVGGLLKVDPKQPVESVRKKPLRKKKPAK